MNNTDQNIKSDAQVLLEELNILWQEAKKIGDNNKRIDLEFEIFKLRKELVELNNSQIRWDQELESRIKTLQFNLDRDKSLYRYQYLTSRWQSKLESRSQGIKLISEAIGYSKIAINTLVIVNAGAVLTILAFLGNTVKVGCRIQQLNFVYYFIIATGLAIATAAFAYFSQIIFSDFKKYKLGELFRWLGVGLATLSLASFGYGSYSALKNLRITKLFIVCL